MKPVFQTVFIATYLNQVVDNSVVDFEDILKEKARNVYSSMLQAASNVRQYEWGPWG